MKVTVKLFGEFRQVAGKERVTLDLNPGATCLSALKALVAQEPELQAMVFQAGQLQDHLHVFLNGQNVVNLQGLATPLHEGDTLTFFPPLSGG